MKIGWSENCGDRAYKEGVGGSSPSAPTRKHDELDSATAWDWAFALLGEYLWGGPLSGHWPAGCPQRVIYGNLALTPPSTMSVRPVMNDERSDVRNRAAPATSDVSPMRFTGET